MKVDNSYHSVKRRYYTALNLINKPEEPLQQSNCEEDEENDNSPIRSEPNFRSFKFQTGAKKQKRSSTEIIYGIPTPTCPIPVPHNQREDQWDEDAFIPPHLLVARNDDEFETKKKRKNFMY